MARYDEKTGLDRRKYNSESSSRRHSRSSSRHKYDNKSHSKYRKTSRHRSSSSSRSPRKHKKRKRSSSSSSSSSSDTYQKTKNSKNSTSKPRNHSRDHKSKKVKRKKNGGDESSTSISSDASTSSSSSSSSDDSRKKRKRKKKEKKKHKKKQKKNDKKKLKKKRRKEEKLLKEKLKMEDKESFKISGENKSVGNQKNNDTANPKDPKSKASTQNEEANIRSFAPMTKEMWEKQQSVLRRVYDEDTGRTRLIRGDGEIMEEIVSESRHKEINKTATAGDGASFQANLANKMKF